MMLFTGFEPFTTGQGLVLSHNPTADIAQRVAGRLSDASFAVLPVSFSRTQQRLTEQFDTHKPRLWIGMGYAPHRTTLDLEVLAVNVEHCASADNDGESPFMRPIVFGGPAAYQTCVDVPTAVDVFAQHNVTLSPAFHAGTFLCNQSFYVACHRVHEGADLQMAAFLHVPPMDSYHALEDALVAWAHELSREV